MKKAMISILILLSILCGCSSNEPHPVLELKLENIDVKQLGIQEIYQVSTDITINEITSQEKNSILPEIETFLTYAQNNNANYIGSSIPSSNTVHYTIMLSNDQYNEIYLKIGIYQDSDDFFISVQVPNSEDSREIEYIYSQSKQLINLLDSLFS